MHPVSDFLPEKTIELLKKQGYFLFGHSGIKTCQYTKDSLRNKKVCYKQKFYGIQSHQCIQFSPASAFCDQKCVYCWRPIQTFLPAMNTVEHETENQRLVQSNQKTLKPFSKKRVDVPSEIVAESIHGQRVQLSGFGGFEDVNRKKWEESKFPRHVAISLTGEPTLYPRLAELVSEFHANAISTFLVSNGLHPEMIEQLIENPPTQLYLSVDSPAKEIHLALNKPDFSDSWERLNKSIALLPRINGRTVIRITCVKGRNMNHAQGFAELCKKGKPDFVEVKGYVHVGFSQHRLPAEAMPSFEEVETFAKEIGWHLGYHYKMHDSESLVCLLVHPQWKNKSTVIPFRKLFPETREPFHGKENAGKVNGRKNRRKTRRAV
jgi:tRNA wybutosine-synthesizing protein 1